MHMYYYHIKCYYFNHYYCCYCSGFVDYRKLKLKLKTLFILEGLELIRLLA